LPYASKWLRVIMLPTVGHRVAVLVLLLAFYRAAFAQHHNHPPQDIALHERFYSTWMRPDNPSTSCCNKQDCYPAEFKLVGGTWFAKRREDGQWVPIPEERFEHSRTDRTPAESPDGRSHVCMEPPFYGVYNVWCAILGFGG
jgi:hypothetical protein